ncbi:hypothetical protein [Marinagarivorans cellulosilyticus]|uniref:Glycosyltransferase 2-like domain-containing protein n=1 Tax=Marinagarivorans cellulosilyticus TaxID=2721545 RepID=A0AAN1WFQ5_9GAMM|nr:hypothetical protein [Marinagarivorans cellulosilyticus]BCD96758.1 hypothetical protein MARGE09_P0958 [Marinagarivorans cellulosilyticus]
MLPAAKKYLDQYAEPLIHQTAAQRSECFAGAPTAYTHVLVIPSYNESTAFVRRLTTQIFDSCKKLLVIVVINQPKERHRSSTRLNQRLWDFCHSSLQGASHKKGIYSLTTRSSKQCDFLCVDQFSEGISSKQGVGYARKLGCDIAVDLIAKGYLSENWLHCTDADATLPNDYFSAPSINKHYSALNYGFTHSFAKVHKSQHQKTTEAASLLYESSIRYYCKGLTYAGSPYAFTTLGSAIAIQPNYYCLVRGFPKRAGGEDFYLLNKLAKLAPIFTMPQTIQLKPRASLRVPFGTGPAVCALLKNNKLTDFNPWVFKHLKEWLEFSPKLHSHITDVSNSPLASLSHATQQALSDIKVQALLEHIGKQSKNSAQTERMIMDWFDGFKTLKFIHALTHNNYPKMGLAELQKNKSFNALFSNTL